MPLGRHPSPDTSQAILRFAERGIKFVKDSW